jgi:ACS family glucarate transporter-like MFS transporter
MTRNSGADRDTLVRWRIFALVISASFVAYVLRSNMSVAGDALRQDMGFSLSELGLILSANAWAYALFQFPGGVFGDRVGPRRALTIVIVAWGVITILTGLVPAAGVLPATAALLLLVVLRFLQGMFQAPIFPVGCAGVISRWFPPSAWALPNGLSSTGLTLGAAATAPAIAWAVENWCWRNAFLYAAPLAFVTAAVWWWYVRDTPAEHPSVSAMEHALIQAGRGADTAATTEPGAWRRVLADRNILLLTGSYFCMNYTFYIFFNWFYIYLVEVRDFRALEGGFLAAGPWIAGAVAATAGGALCDRLCVRHGARRGCRVPAVAGLALVSVLLLAGATADDPYLAVLLLSLCFACTQLTEGAFWYAAISIAGRNAASAGGIMNTGGNAVGGVGALLIPAIAERAGWVPALASGSVFALIGVVLWLFIRADEVMENPREEEN